MDAKRVRRQASGHIGGSRGRSSASTTQRASPYEAIKTRNENRLNEACSEQDIGDRLKQGVRQRIAYGAACAELASELRLPDHGNPKQGRFGDEHFRITGTALTDNDWNWCLATDKTQAHGEAIGFAKDKGCI